MKRYLIILALFPFLLCACSKNVSCDLNEFFREGARYAVTAAVNGAAIDAILEFPSPGTIAVTFAEGDAAGLRIVADGEGCRYRYGDLAMPLKERKSRAEAILGAVEFLKRQTLPVRKGEAAFFEGEWEGRRVSFRLSSALSPERLILEDEGGRVELDFH